jgi:hypothetical protein
LGLRVDGGFLHDFDGFVEGVVLSVMVYFCDLIYFYGVMEHDGKDFVVRGIELYPKDLAVEHRHPAFVAQEFLSPLDVDYGDLVLGDPTVDEQVLCVQ